MYNNKLSIGLVNFKTAETNYYRSVAGHYVIANFVNCALPGEKT